MKAILQSIKPQYCELIAAGKKTIEVRKTIPKIQTPFKVYIYCTKGEKLWKKGNSVFLDKRYNRLLQTFDYMLNGKIIGEYVCNEIDKVVHAGTTNQNIELCFLDNGWNYTPLIAEFYRKSCLTYAELEKYSKGGDIYGYHISNLVIYDKPKGLYEFNHLCIGDCDECKYSYYENFGNSFYGEPMLACDRRVTRPPQSWCYVEEK